jgi:serine acetyltransferase
MGRTERRHELVKGPTIRRAARVGGGAVICPGIEIGEEAFVGAGAVVTNDVAPGRSPSATLRVHPTRKTSCSPNQASRARCQATELTPR